MIFWTWTSPWKKKKKREYQLKLCLTDILANHNNNNLLFRAKWSLNRFTLEHINSHMVLHLVNQTILATLVCNIILIMANKSLLNMANKFLLNLVNQLLNIVNLPLKYETKTFDWFSIRLFSFIPSKFLFSFLLISYFF